jgi:hypothetical protein
MNFKLTRNQISSDGVFGSLYDNSGKQILVTAEHAFTLTNGTVAPKVKAGTYTCLRHAPNRLPYETWELQNVPNFDGKPVTAILIHIGNYPQTDSDGCILVGSSRNGEMILDSKETFADFMNLTIDENNLTLTIEDV